MTPRCLAALLVLLRAACAQSPVPGYAPAESCETCHAEKAATYRGVSMAQTFAPVANVEIIEDYIKENHFFHEASGEHFRMFQRDGKFYQRRYQLDERGNKVRAFEQQITHVIGSGRHARSYLHLSGSGELTQLPVTWYTQEKRWGMSPGYDRPKHYEFSRVIDAGCLFCHNGYPAGVDDRYGSRPVFREPLPAGIDCQRCHGPGANHVALATAGNPLQAIRAAIANPKRTAPDRQMDVCLQCHLETTSEKLPHALRRFGRGIFSFRPGERLDEYRIDFDHAASAGREDKFEINSAGYRLLQSACYLKSAGKLTCTTCHNPHSAAAKPKTQSPACLQCHAGHGGAERKDCVACHMPKRRAEDAVHVIMTDHRIQRRPPPRDREAPLTERRAPYRGQVVFYGSLKLPPDERDLYLGLALVTDGADLARGADLLRKALAAQSGPAPIEARSAFARALATQGKAAEAAGQLRLILAGPTVPAAIRADYAKLLEQLGQPQSALREYKQALSESPGLPAAHLGIARLATDFLEAAANYRHASMSAATRAEALNNLGALQGSRGELEAARYTLEAALATDPAFAEAENNLARVLALSGQIPEALEHVQRALALDPDYPEARYNFARLLHASGQTAAAIIEYERAIVLRPALAEAHLSLGVAFAESGRIDEAIREFRETVRLDPRHPEAGRNLRLALERKGQ